MSKDRLLLAASLLLLVGFVLLVVGLGGARPLWLAGLATVVLAMLLSLGTRWAREAPAAEPEEPGAGAGGGA